MKASTRQAILSQITRARETELEAQDYLAHMIHAAHEAGITADEVDKAIFNAEALA